LLINLFNSIISRGSECPIAKHPLQESGRIKHSIMRVTRFVLRGNSEKVLGAAVENLRLGNQKRNRIANGVNLTQLSPAVLHAV